MKSSSGEYFAGLDHVRALAALLVVSWHFMHGSAGKPVPFAGAPAVFPLSVFDEGHIGVALFMVLSGYLFGKLTWGKKINYGWFLWNRLIRLLPLLLAVCVMVALEKALSGDLTISYFKGLLSGLLLPSLPNGGWSITVEVHFYILFPLFAVVLRAHAFGLLALLIAATLFRYGLHAWYGEVQTLSYWTIIGRVDQFAIGLWASRHGALLPSRVCLLIVGGFLCAVHAFNVLGGFYLMPAYPSPSQFWIFWPGIEGFAMAAVVLLFDRHLRGVGTAAGRISRLFGQVSYSMYLLHPFVVFRTSRLAFDLFPALANFYVALLASFLFYIAMLPVAYLGFLLFEKPFFRYRRKYVVQ